MMTMTQIQYDQHHDVTIQKGDQYNEAWQKCETEEIEEGKTQNKMSDVEGLYIEQNESTLIERKEFWGRVKHRSHQRARRMLVMYNYKITVNII